MENGEKYLPGCSLFYWRNVLHLSPSEFLSIVRLGLLQRMRKKWPLSYRSIVYVVYRPHYWVLWLIADLRPRLRVLLVGYQLEANILY